MDKVIVKAGKELRLGYTTGTCAAAASKAAATMLATGELMSLVHITTPSGINLQLELVEIVRRPGYVSCAVVKDGGDDPDVTTGLKIFAAVKSGGCGISVFGGDGIGRVTQPGLVIPIGNPAINPVPLQAITRELEAILAQYPALCGLSATISAPGGQEIAKKTFNPRLGIIGGISILGTTGIVEPMSEKAIIETICLEIDIRKHRQQSVLLLTPGNYGVDFIRDQWDIDLDQGVKCSNFIGEALDYAVYSGFHQILLVGHVGKLIKLAAGIMNTHSKVADGRMEVLAAHAGMAGADVDTIRALMACTTTDAALAVLADNPILGVILSSINTMIIKHLAYRVGSNVDIAVVIFRDSRQLLCISNQAQVARMVDLLRIGAARQ